MRGERLTNFCARRHQVPRTTGGDVDHSLCSLCASPCAVLCSIDNDLVQEDSEFRASRQFGMSYISPQGGVAEIGTILEITGHSPYADGRLLVTTKGGTSWTTKLRSSAAPC